MGESVGTDSGFDDLDVVLNNLEVKLEGSAFTDMLVRRRFGWGVGVRVKCRDRVFF